MMDYYVHASCYSKLEFKKGEGWWCPKCEGFVATHMRIPWLKGRGEEMTEGKKEGEKYGEGSGTGAGEGEVDKAQEGDSGSRPGCKGLLPESQQVSREKAQESSPGSEEDSQGSQTGDTGLRKGNVTHFRCPSCGSKVFEASELMEIFIQDGKVFLEEAGAMIAKGKCYCLCCGYPVNLKELERKVNEEKTKADSKAT